MNKMDKELLEDCVRLLNEYDGDECYSYYKLLSSASEEYGTEIVEKAMEVINEAN